MRYLVLACDYDGTLALNGKVDEATLGALEKLLASGRKLVMVTGRELPDLQQTFDAFQLFEWVVAENGALLYHPGTKTEKVLAEPPPSGFVAALKNRGVGPISVGRAIVATWHPHENAVLETIRAMNLEHQVIFNKDAVMILPPGVNKASGLMAALREMKLSPHNVVGIGDAENDHAFFKLCEACVAVDNALPKVKEAADLVTRGHHGQGVAELIDKLLDNDLKELEGKLTRHQLLLGTTPADEKVYLPPFGTNILIAGPSGSGKSTASTGLLERLADCQYQYCVIDPEGDYEGFEHTVTLGSPRNEPRVEEVLQLLDHPQNNVIVNMVGMPITDRPSFFLSLLPRLLEMRSRTGRPHWILVDEAHHLLPNSWVPGGMALSRELDRMVFVTVHPDLVAPGVLSAVDTFLAVGNLPRETLGMFFEAAGKPLPPIPEGNLEPGEILAWSEQRFSTPIRLRAAPNRTEHRRHIRKYAEGELPPDRSFFFRGPENKLNLRAQNLFLFLQLAQGVDDETWEFHLRQGDYSKWFREAIKDASLAAEAERIEQLSTANPQESRDLIRQAVERIYTLPASPALPMPGTDAKTVRG